MSKYLFKIIMADNKNILSEAEKKNSKTIRTFGWASFLNDMGSDMIYPVWPLFIKNVLHANMAVLGFIDGLGEALVSLAKAVSGYWSDKTQKRKSFIWIGYFFSSVSRIGYALSTTWPMLIPCKILDRAGKIRSAPRDALISELSTRNNRAANFGFLKAMDNWGAVVGILLCLLLFKHLGYRNLFFLSAFPSVIGAFFIIKYIEEKPPSAKIFKGLRFRHLSGNLKFFFFLNIFLSLGSFTYSFLLLYAHEAGLESGFIPVLYLIYTLSAAFFVLPFGKLADKIGRKVVLMISYLCWLFLCMGFLFFKTPFLMVLYFIFYGIHKAALEPSQKTMVAEMAPEEYKASILGGFQMVTGICALPASFFAGILWEKWGACAPFLFSLVLTVAGMLMLMFVPDTKKRENYFIVNKNEE